MILNCLFVLDQKKKCLISHDCFSLETIFERLLENENNQQQSRQVNKFNFESFRNFLKTLGIESTFIKDLIDLFSSFDIKQECYLGI